MNCSSDETTHFEIRALFPQKHIISNRRSGKIEKKGLESGENEE